MKEMRFNGNPIVLGRVQITSIPFNGYYMPDTREKAWDMNKTDKISNLIELILLNGSLIEH